MNEIKISVVIPTYNRPTLVAMAVDCVLAQTYKAAEIIVVDDGSADNPAEALARFGDKIRIIRQENTGLSGARNTGVLAARHDWIAFLDDDDEYTTERLAQAIESINRFPTASVHLTNTLIVGEGQPDTDLFKLRGVKVDEWTPVDSPITWVLKGCFFCQSLVVKKTLLIETGLFRKTFYEDLDMYVRLALHTPWIVNSRPALRLIRRSNTVTCSDEHRSRPAEKCSTLIRIHREALSLPKLSTEETASVRNGLASYLFELGMVMSEKNDSATARQHFAEAISHFKSPKSRAKARAALWGGRPVVRFLQWQATRRKGFVR